MTTRTTSPSVKAHRWEAVLRRDGSERGTFVYAVQTTGVYCSPGCASRRPNRGNVRFFDDWRAAETAGYRACRRCRPREAAANREAAGLVVAACRLLAERSPGPSLAELAAATGASQDRLQRTFLQELGLTPKQFAGQLRSDRLRRALLQAKTVTEAFFAAGYASLSRGYAEAGDALGMTPRQFARQGSEATIHYGVASCSLGLVAAAVSEKGVCHLALGDDEAALVAEIHARFAQASCTRSSPYFKGLLEQVVASIDDPTRGLALPLDLRGTAFQRRVWLALREIPAGETRTYSQLAAAIGAPQAVRAVAGACAANRLATAVPCHRAVRADGSLSGYRWGLKRKQELLEREQADESDREST